MFLLPFHVIGCSRETSSADALGQLRVLPDQLEAPLRVLRESGTPAVLLSTCHRTELYWWGDDDLTGWFTSQLLARAPDGAVVTRRDNDLAVRHLFAVAAGMHSARLGEPEILGQVRRAWRAALDMGTSVPAMDDVFRHAIDAARHIRVAMGADAQASLGAQVHGLLVARRRDGQLASGREPVMCPTILVVGAGNAACGVLDALADSTSDHGPAWEIRLTSRTDARAAAVAARYGVEHAAWATREFDIAAADVVIFAAHAVHPIVNRAMLAEIDARRESPALWMDLGVPPNVECAGEAAPGYRRRVDVVGLDALGVSALSDAPRRQRAVAALQHELARYATSVQRRRVGERMAVLEAHAVHAAQEALSAGTSADEAAAVVARQITRVLLRELTSMERRSA